MLSLLDVKNHYTFLIRNIQKLKTPHIKNSLFIIDSKVDEYIIDFLFNLL